MVKLLKERKRVNLHELGLCDGFLDTKPKLKATTTKYINWTSPKLKTLQLQLIPSRK